MKGASYKTGTSIKQTNRIKYSAYKHKTYSVTLDPNNSQTQKYSLFLYFSRPCLMAEKVKAQVANSKLVSIIIITQLSQLAHQTYVFYYLIFPCFVVWYT